MTKKISNVIDARPSKRDILAAGVDNPAQAAQLQTDRDEYDKAKAEAEAEANKQIEEQRAKMLEEQELNYKAFKKIGSTEDGKRVLKCIMQMCEFHNLAIPTDEKGEIRKDHLIIMQVKKQIWGAIAESIEPKDRIAIENNLDAIHELK